MLALVLAPDLDSYLLARGHPLTMGKKERERKEKRAKEAAAAADSDAPPYKAAAPKPPVPKGSYDKWSLCTGVNDDESTLAGGSASRASSVSSGSVETESLVAGSGTPASSVSSGRVEAEGCGSWEYNEGVDGQYLPLPPLLS